MEDGKFIECRKLKITPLSAANLPNVRNISRMKVYAKVTIGGRNDTEKGTEADEDGEKNPTWGSSMQYTIGESGVKHHGLELAIKLYCKRRLGDRFIGVVQKSIKDLFDSATEKEEGGGSRSCSGEMTCPLKMSDSSSKYSKSQSQAATLTFSYMFGDRVPVKRPSKWKRFLNCVAVVLMKVTCDYTFGIDFPFEDLPIFFYPDPDAVIE